MPASHFGCGFLVDTQQQLRKPCSQTHPNSEISGHTMTSDQKHNTKSNKTYKACSLHSQLQIDFNYMSMHFWHFYTPKSDNQHFSNRSLVGGFNPFEKY